MYPRVGVGVFVCRDGKFLMGKRKNSHGADTWSIPGGHLEFGETPEQTAVRELAEETGLRIDTARFAAVTNDIFDADKKQYVTIWMLGDWTAGDPQVTEPDKFVEQQWVDFDSLPQPLFLPWEQLLHSEFIDGVRAALRSTKHKETSRSSETRCP